MLTEENIYTIRKLGTDCEYFTRQRFLPFFPPHSTKLQYIEANPLFLVGLLVSLNTILVLCIT